MAPPPPPAVELRALTKRFGGVLANAGVDLRVTAGTIHGVIGENGAGKSTAMKLLLGLLPADAGQILIRGERWARPSPAGARALGLGMVHQHFLLADPYTALDNLLLAEGPGRPFLLRRDAARAELRALAARHGLEMDWDAPVASLPVGVRQRLEILKLLAGRADILVLDEPTAVLTPLETGRLFEQLRRLRDEGKTVILVTHKLREVMAVTDQISVFRAGRVTGERRTSETTPEELAQLMVGRPVALRWAAAPGLAGGVERLAVADLGLAAVGGAARPRLSGITFSVGAGEIVGVAGVEGNGQSELLQALLHPRDRRCRTGGTVRILGREVTRWSPRAIRELGVGVVPEDRLREGLLPARPLWENFLLGHQRESAFQRGGLLRPAAVAAAAARAVADYDVRPPALGQAAGALSGGNQQKLILARELGRAPRLILAAQPTRGVDVGAIEDIHQRLVRARDAGAGVLLVSSELEEIRALADRILVMFDGRIVAEYARGGATERELGLKMGGA